MTIGLTRPVSQPYDSREREEISVSKLPDIELHGVAASCSKESKQVSAICLAVAANTAITNKGRSEGTNLGYPWRIARLGISQDIHSGQSATADLQQSGFFASFPYRPRPRFVCWPGVLSSHPCANPHKTAFFWHIIIADAFGFPSRTPSDSSRHPRDTPALLRILFKQIHPPKQKYPGLAKRHLRRDQHPASHCIIIPAEEFNILRQPSEAAILFTCLARC